MMQRHQLQQSYNQGHSYSRHTRSISQPRQRDESPLAYQYSKNNNSHYRSHPDSPTVNANVNANVNTRRSKSKSNSAMKYSSDSEIRSRSSSRQRSHRSHSRPRQPSPSHPQQYQQQIPRQRRKQPQQRDLVSTPRRGYSPAPRQGGGAAGNSISTSNPYPSHRDAPAAPAVDNNIQALSTSYDNQLSLEPNPMHDHNSYQYHANNTASSSSSSSGTGRRSRSKSKSQNKQRNNTQSQSLTTTFQSTRNEDTYNTQVMKEREAEILKINQQMHTVNEIYQDLAGIVDGQQELIDQIDEQIELSNTYAKQGNENYLEARLWAENPILEDPFGEKLGLKSTTAAARQQGDVDGHHHYDQNQQFIDDRGRLRRRKNPHDKRKQRSKSRHKSKHQMSSSSNNNNNLLKNDTSESAGMDCSAPIAAMPEDVQVVFKTGIQDIKELGSKLMNACTAPDFDEVNEYAYRPNSAKNNNASPYDQFSHGGNGQEGSFAARYDSKQNRNNAMNRKY